MISPRYKQHQTRTTQAPPLADTQELTRLKNRLIASAKSQATVEILRTATLAELRGIQKAMTEIDVNATLMEWTTHVFLEAVRNTAFPSLPTVHQWKNALLFVHERMKTRNCVNRGESWMRQHQQVVLAALLTDFRGISAAAAKFLAATPLKFFFNGALCFASHFAKHGVQLKMKVADYLQKAADLFQRTPFAENGALCFRRHGWSVYVAQEKGKTYIKTLHLKANYHEAYLAAIL